MKSNSKILSIEAIRGFASIYVLLGHIVLLYQPYDYLPKYEFLIKTLFGYGHQAVILFFIVSGFSIHYSSSNVDFNQNGSVKEYIFKRGRRIYPLFLISLIISFIVLYITQIPSNWISNTLSFFFLTGNFSSSFAYPISTNGPIWSLSYEVLYYLMYPMLLISINRMGILKTFIISIIISLFSLLFSFLVLQNHFSNVFQLFWIWMIGVVIAEMKIKNSRISTTYLMGFLTLSIAYMFTFDKMDILYRDWNWAIFFSLIIISFFSKLNPLTIYQKIGNLFIGLIGIVICYFSTFNDTVSYHPQLLRYMLILYAISSLVLNFIPFQFIQNVLRWLLKPFVHAGSFSYALYIFHWPLILLSLHIFKNYLQLNSGILFGIIGINLIFVFFLAWYCEVKLQPMMAGTLNKYYYAKKR